LMSGLTSWARLLSWRIVGGFSGISLTFLDAVPACDEIRVFAILS